MIAGAQQPVAVHMLVHAINAALGALGTTVTGIASFTKPAAKIGELASDIGAKKISTLVILGGNPVYDAPADLDWAEAAADHPDGDPRGPCTRTKPPRTPPGTSPRAHYLEYWGDGRSADGTYVSVQPMILPLFGGWSDNDILAQIRRPAEA